MTQAAQNAARRARRRRRSLARQLRAYRCCIECGESDLQSLLPVRKSSLEDHHAVTEANDPRAVVPLCRPCHVDITEEMRDRGIPMRRQPSLHEQLVAVLSALIAFFARLVIALKRWRDALQAWIALQDERDPNWRQYAPPVGGTIS